MSKLITHISGVTIPGFLLIDKERKSKLGGEETKRAYVFLTQLYGEQCSSCGNIPDENTIIEIDHIDENPKRHYWKNLQLLCHKCNCKKRSSIEIKRKGRIKVAINNDNLKNANAETYLKSVYLIAFLNFLESEFKEQNQYNYKDLLSDASLVCGFASEETIKRYIKQLLSRRFGILEKFKDERTEIEYIKLVGKIEDFRTKFKW